MIRTRKFPFIGELSEPDELGRIQQFLYIRLNVKKKNVGSDILKRYRRMKKE